MTSTRPHRFPLWTFVPLLFLLVSGIGRHDVPLDRYYERAKDPAFVCVGELYVKGDFVSSCVLVNKRYVLTTAHSVFADSKKEVDDSISTPVGMRPIKRAAYTYQLDAKQVTVKINEQVVRCKQVFIHPLYVNSFQGPGLHDVAILELEKEVPGVTVPEFYTGETLNKKGIAVGCGEVSTADDYEGKKSYKRVKMAGENMIDSATEVCLWADMDHPDLPGFNRIGSDKPLGLEWIGSGGDCGSPLFIEENNNYYLVGISFSPASYHDMYYFGKLKGTDYGFITGWTKISAAQSWISTIIK